MPFSRRIKKNPMEFIASVEGIWSSHGKRHYREPDACSARDDLHSGPLACVLGAVCLVWAQQWEELSPRWG